MSNNLNNKTALVEWDKFRESTRKSTPVDLSETADQKKKRFAQLEANPQEWKQYYFPKYFKYPSPEFHLKASKRLLKNFAKNKHWYEVRHWARGLSKSTTLMFDVLFLIMTGKLKNIILTSSTYDAAEGFLNKYMVQLDSNQRLINDYGKQELSGSWSVGNFTTRNGVKMMALGAGQSPRGNGNEEIRPDCIIVDDFDTDEECRNIDIINKKWDWFEKALFFTVDTAEPYLVVWVGNIIAEDCCVVRAGKIADHSEIINIRDENGVSVWASKNSEADIDYQLSKVSWESAQQEMFNNPVRQGQTFKEITYGDCPPLNKLQFAVVYADPSPSNRDRPTLKSKAQNSCKAAWLIGCYDGKFYIYKGFVDNTTNSNFIDWLFVLKNYVGTKTQLYTYIENNTLQNPFYEQVLLPLIFEKSRENKEALMVTPDTTQKPEKWFRIEGTLEPLNRLGKLIFNKAEMDDPNMKRLEAQFKSANPNSKTLDGCDAVQGGVIIIQNKMAVAAVGGIYAAKRPQNSKRY